MLSVGMGSIYQVHVEPNNNYNKVKNIISCHYGLLRFAILTNVSLYMVHLQALSVITLCYIYIGAIINDITCTSTI